MPSGEGEGKGKGRPLGKGPERGRAFGTWGEQQEGKERVGRAGLWPSRKEEGEGGRPSAHGEGKGRGREKAYGPLGKGAGEGWRAFGDGKE